MWTVRRFEQNCSPRKPVDEFPGGLFHPNRVRPIARGALKFFIITGAIPGNKSVFVRERDPGHFGEMTCKGGMQGFGNGERDQSRADAVGGFGRQVGRAGVVD